MKFIFLLSAAFMMLALSFGENRALMAQQNMNCCSYTIDLEDVPPTCFPLLLTTKWGVTTLDVRELNGNGLYWFRVPGPCPPALPFKWASLMGDAEPRVIINSCAQNVIGCCLWLCVKTDPAGCIYITIRPC